MTARNPNPKIRKWTEAEDSVIREHYPSGGAAACRRGVGSRTDMAIASRAARLGVRANAKWDEDSIEYLRRHYPTSGKQHCMIALGRTDAQIRQKASDLGLIRDRNSPEYQAQMEAVYETQSKRLKGGRRPDQSEVIKAMWEAGKFDTERVKAARVEAGKVLGARTRTDHPRGMLGKHHTEEAKMAMSQALKLVAEARTEDERRALVMKQMKAKLEKTGKVSRPRKNVSWKGGWREVGGQRCYFRSAWEANYARVLQHRQDLGQIICWEHEPDTFWFDGVKRGCVSYLPDFKVTTYDGGTEYHEVKGWMDAASKTKIKRMAKYHPTITLVVIDSPKYLRLQGEYRWQIADWE